MSDFPRALLTAIVTATPEIAAVVGIDGTVTWINPAFVTQWPCAESPEVRGLLDVVHPDDHADVEAAWEVVADGRLRTIVRTARLGCDHTYRDGRVRFIRVDGPDGPDSVVIHVTDLEPRFVPNGDMDPLTGLADRATFFAEIDAALATGGSGQVVLVDLDHFHVVNESLGHGVGDDLLVTMARRIRDTAHDGDVVARISGDEYGVLCCHLDADPGYGD